ncbi:MAG TPA: DUF2267 domain-containing protein [Candidatus Binatia bacterium]
MSMTGLEVFDTTVHKTNNWLNAVSRELGEEDKHKAYLAMRATLHALRDRLTVEEAAHLGAQLPMLMRGFYYEGWDPTGKPLKERHKEQFLARIERQFKEGDCADAERIARASFAVLERRISDGEIEDIRHVLPEDIRELWP